jgi:hypothetical protein
MGSDSCVLLRRPGTCCGGHFLRSALRLQPESLASAIQKLDTGPLQNRNDLAERFRARVDRALKFPILRIVPNAILDFLESSPCVNQRGPRLFACH